MGELAADPPKSLIVAGDPLPKDIHWVRPELVAEVQFASWSGAGRVRHAVYLGLREDKAATEVVREPADPEAERKPIKPRAAGRRGEAWPVVAVPPRRTGRSHSAASRQERSDRDSARTGAGAA